MPSIGAGSNITAEGRPKTFTIGDKSVCGADQLGHGSGVYCVAGGAKLCHL